MQMSGVNVSDSHAKPEGVLSLQTIAMPADTNWSGDVFGGWIVSQMDLAGAIHAERFSKGRCATISINQMTFLVPVKVGDVISCYTKILKVGNLQFKCKLKCGTAMMIHVKLCVLPKGYLPLLRLMSKAQNVRFLKKPNRSF